MPYNLLITMSDLQKDRRQALHTMVELSNFDPLSALSLIYLVFRSVS